MVSKIVQYPEQPDVLIVGAGSAGCVVANRLSEDQSLRVMLIEAGGHDGSIFLKMPAAFALAISSNRYDWGFMSEPEPALNHRRIPCPRGKVLGGSSSINAMGFTRGNRADFRRWSEVAGPSWNFDNCLEYFKRIESFSGPSGAYRGDSGPMHVQAPSGEHMLYRSFVRACNDAGFASSDDVNGLVQEGFGPMDQNIRDGQRCSASVAYLHPIMKRPNLRVKKNIVVRRILFSGMRAVGVEIESNGQICHIRAKREVVLCAGAINSPYLLLHSGIGPAGDLHAFGIGVVKDSPHVGKNLQDHLDVSVKRSCSEPVSETPQLKWLRKGLIGLQWIATRTGPGATNHFEVTGFIKSEESLDSPNLQIYFVPMLVNYDGTALPASHGYQATAMLARPKSRGSLQLQSPDLASPPRLNFNYLSEPADVEALVEAVKIVRKIFRQPTLAALGGSEILPGEDVQDHGAIVDYIRETAKTTHHPCGTCAMGTQPDAVVDPEGLVNGIEGLRVVDSSIIPIIPSANINAPTLMLAEKISAAMRRPQHRSHKEVQTSHSHGAAA